MLNAIFEVDTRKGRMGTVTINSRLYPYLAGISLVTRQGFPTATRFAGTSRTTTLPAPITLLSPMVTPGQMTQLPPSHTLFPIVTGFANSSPLRRTSASTG